MYKTKLNLTLSDLLSSLSKRQQDSYRDHVMMMLSFANTQYEKRSLYPYKTETELFLNELTVLRKNFFDFEDNFFIQPDNFESL